MNIERLSEIIRAFSVHGYDNIEVGVAHDLIMFAAPENVPEELKETLDQYRVRWDKREKHWYVFV